MPDDTVYMNLTTVHTHGDTCSHGYTPEQVAGVDDDGRTSCCGAYTSIHMDDGVEYCKCCYGEVGYGSITERITFDL